MTDASAAADDGPFEEQRRVYDLLSQETRHLVLQYVLGHPAHLPSLDELAYMMPKNKAAIRDQLQVLSESGIIDEYRHPPNEESRDLPSQFYGLTEYGVEVLDEYNYLDGLPVVRAIYDNTRLSEKARRHLDAPRPQLPEVVEDVLAIDEAEDAADYGSLERYIRTRNGDNYSIGDQVAVARAFHEAGIGPDHDGITRSDLSERLDVDVDYHPRTILEHLVDIDVVEESEPDGPDVFAISGRADEIVNGRVTEEAKKSLQALVAHIDDELQSVELGEETPERGGPWDATSKPSVALSDGAGRTVRSILAAEFEVDPEAVVNYLQSGDPVDRLNAAVAAIESAEEVSKSEDYGRIVFVHQAYRYRLTDRAMTLLSGGSAAE